VPTVRPPSKGPPTFQLAWPALRESASTKRSKIGAARNVAALRNTDHLPSVGEHEAATRCRQGPPHSNSHRQSPRRPVSGARRATQKTVPSPSPAALFMIAPDRVPARTRPGEGNGHFTLGVRADAASPAELLRSETVHP